MTEGERMTGFSDAERLALAATWTDDAYQRLGDELNRACGGKTPDMVTMDLDTMEALHDGLWVLAGNLHALNLPYPPPAVPPRRPHLSVVK